MSFFQRDGGSQDSHPHDSVQDVSPRSWSLEVRFLAWCRQAGADTAAAAVLWSRLQSHYSEPQRHYHNLGHIEASLEELDRCSSKGLALEGAIWFHDVIYNPTRGDNEEASILWFRQTTGDWINPALAGRIAGLIEATDFRKKSAEDAETILMVDIDLAILSAPPKTYDAYAVAIRSEYAHVSDEDFRKGRAKVMAGFLGKQIYRSARFTGREERARLNIARELEKLRAE